MQQPPSIPRSLTEFLWYLLATFFALGGGAGFWSYLRFRKKDTAETHEAEARSRSLDVRSTVMAGDAVLRYIDRLSNTHATIDDLHRERDEWRDKAERIEAANALLERQLSEVQVMAKYWEGEAKRRR